MHNFVDVFNSVERFRRGKFSVLDRTEDPTFLSFSIDFPFGDNTTTNPFFGFPTSPLFADETSDYSAAKYLKALGLGANLARINEFNKILKDVIFPV